LVTLFFKRGCSASFLFLCPTKFKSSSNLYKNARTPERTKSKKGKICYMKKKKMKSKRREENKKYNRARVFRERAQKLPFLSFKRSKRVPLSINILRGKESLSRSD